MKHEILDRRALTYARLIAWRIDHDPERKGLRQAKKNLSRLSRNNGYYKWKEILSQPWKVIRKKMCEQTDEMQYLRQMTPFHGNDCMPEDLRQRVVNKYLARNGKPPLEFRPITFPLPPSSNKIYKPRKPYKCPAMTKHNGK